MLQLSAKLHPSLLIQSSNNTGTTSVFGLITHHSPVATSVFGLITHHLTDGYACLPTYSF